MRDYIVEEILRNPALEQNRTRRGYVKPVIPAANRYPHSVLRADLENARQPWNRTLLGSPNYGSFSSGSYRPAA